jgi:rod shape-determining protein MreD
MIQPIRLVWYSAAALILMLVQLNLGYVSVESVTPDLLLILVVFIALREGQFSGLIAGFIIGLFFDVVSSDITGTNALAKMLAGFTAGFFFDEQLGLAESVGRFRFLGILALSTFVHNLIYYFFYVRPTDLNFAGFFLKSGIAATLYTTVVGVLIMLAAARKKTW